MIGVIVDCTSNTKTFFSTLILAVSCIDIIIKIFRMYFSNSVFRRTWGLLLHVPLVLYSQRPCGSSLTCGLDLGCIPVWGIFEAHTLNEVCTLVTCYISRGYAPHQHILSVRKRARAVCSFKNLKISSLYCSI